MGMISFSPKPVWNSETLTIDNTAGGIPLTATKYFKQVGNTASDRMKANSAFISVEDQPIRVNLDPAVTVTATTNGHLYAAGDSFIVEGQALVDFRAIRSGGTSGTIRVTYFA